MTARCVCTSAFVLACLAVAAAVPEPVTLSVIGFGLFGLASRLRRETRRRVA